MGGVADDTLKCYLRALQPGDDEVTLRWRQQDHVWSGLIGPRRAVSAVTEHQWLLRAIEDHATGRVLRFGICRQKDHELCGLIRFGSVDLLHRTCDTGRLIGDPAAQGQGYAFHARLIGFDYMFSQWNMHRIETLVLATNDRSVASLERFGLVREGTKRQATLKDGRWTDVHLYAITEAEFRAAHPTAAGAWRAVR